MSSAWACHGGTTFEIDSGMQMPGEWTRGAGVILWRTKCSCLASGSKGGVVGGMIAHPMLLLLLAR